MYQSRDVLSLEMEESHTGKKVTSSHPRHLPKCPSSSSCENHFSSVRNLFTRDKFICILVQNLLFSKRTGVTDSTPMDAKWVFNWITRSTPCVRVSAGSWWYAAYPLENLPRRQPEDISLRPQIPFHSSTSRSFEIWSRVEKKSNCLNFYRYRLLI